MLNELKSSTTLLQSYLTWAVNLSAGGVAAYILLLCFSLFLMVEFCEPREKILPKQLRQSYRANIGLFTFNSVVMSTVAVPALLMLAEHCSGKGLLNHIHNPLGKIVLSFVAIDLLLYCLHKACHRFDCLWMIHKVHHNDPCLNVSTAFRIHFLEIVIINLVKAIAVVVLGVEGLLLVVNEAIIIFFTMLHHANISFRGERFLGWVIITPYLHRVHHSVRRDQHDRNYGAVLSIWDRLFGTLAVLKPEQIGVNGSSAQDLISLLKCGFTLTDSSPAGPDLKAYYKAARDWLKAKIGIIGSVCAKGWIIRKWRGAMKIMHIALQGKNRKYPLYRKQMN